MIESLHIRGYRSLELVRLPLAPLTVVTGANGTGKSNLYRCLQLLVISASSLRTDQPHPPVCIGPLRSR
jgi:predicted ATPase